MTLELHDYPDWQKPLATADLLTSFNDAAVAVGNTSGSGNLDVRKYSSTTISLAAFAANTVDAYHPVGVVVEWLDNALADTPMWTEGFRVFANNPGAATKPANGGWLRIAMPVMAPYLRVTMSNTGSDTMVLGGDIVGSSRSLPAVFVRESVDPTLINPGASDAKLIGGQVNIAAGAVGRTVLRLHVGRVQCVWGTASQTATFNIYAADGDLIMSDALAANTTLKQEVVLPSQTCRLEITNTGAALSTFQRRVVADRTAY